jgi:hypothetical protein
MKIYILIDLNGCLEKRDILDGMFNDDGDDDTDDDNNNNDDNDDNDDDDNDDDENLHTYRLQWLPGEKGYIR